LHLASCIQPPGKISVFFTQKGLNARPGCKNMTLPAPKISGGKQMASKVRIRLKGYDHNLVDKAAEQIVEAAKRGNAQIAGPIPLPTEKEIITVLRAVHKYKDSREQFEQRTHKRLIDVIAPTPKTVEALTNLQLPAGVDITVDFR